MEGTNYYSQIGIIIKELREKLNMTKTKLAEHICSVSYITRIENGERCPHSVILRQLSNKLGVTPEYLFRVIESPTGWDLKKAMDQITLYMERDNYKSILKLINTIEEKNIQITTLREIKIIRNLKYISHAMLNQNYEWGIKEIEKNNLGLTYTKDGTLKHVDFPLMFHYGFLLLLNNQKEEAYCLLLKIKKQLNNIKQFSAYAIFPKYYVYLVSACLDTSNFHEALSYIDIAINYCKEHNIHTLLRELYFLKGELCYHLNNKKDFEYWYNKSLTLHELIKKSDDEYFTIFIKNRMNRIS